MTDSRYDADFELDDAKREVLRRHARVIAGNVGAGAAVTTSHVFRPPADLTPAEGIGLLAAMALVMLSGFASGSLVDAFGVRAASVLLSAVAAAASFGLAGVSPGRHDSLSRGERIALLAVPLLAAATGSATVLALVPAVVHGTVAGVMLASLDDEAALIEKAARISQPLAPAFIGPYCRTLTAVWGGLFAASAAITAVLAIGGWQDGHRAWTAWMFWSLVGVFSVAEFFFRKARFRYYGSGPFDRMFSRLFPSQNTALGRRSMAYATRMREELVRLAEAERERTRS